METSQWPSSHQGTVHNVVTGQVGSLVQAGDVTGASIAMGDGPPAIVQARSHTNAERDLKLEVVAFLRQIASGELAPRTAESRAGELADRLDDLD